jgi:hypothetical protein
LLYPALAAAERIDATVANMRFAKPLDVALVTDLARRHDAIVTVEEGTILGGAGSAVLEALAEARIEIPVLTLGLPDTFVEQPFGTTRGKLPACRLSIGLWYGPKSSSPRRTRHAGRRPCAKRSRRPRRRSPSTPPARPRRNSRSKAWMSSG